LHYDNAGTDRNEFIEIGCNREVDVTGYKIVLYNGKNRKEYNTSFLSGLCSPLTNFVVQNYNNEIENGWSDGIALVNEIDEVIEFISYEGFLEALDGLAIGMTSVDIGVSENSGASADDSLQLVGKGCNRSDFTWLSTPAPSSADGVNNGQEIGCDLRD